MCAVGVGGADAVDAMANLPWELKVCSFSSRSQILRSRRCLVAVLHGFVLFRLPA